MPPAFPPYLMAGALACAVVSIFALLARWGKRSLRCPAGWAAASSKEPPPDVLAELSPWLARLAHFGFRSVLLQRSLSAAHAEGYRWLLVNESERTFATLDRLIAASGSTYPQVELTFFTSEPTGTLHVTADRRGFRHFPFYWSLIQKRFRKVETQWREHLDALPALERRHLPAAGTLASLLASDESARHAAYLEGGGYVATDGQVLKPRLRLLPRLVGDLFRGGSRSRLSRRDVSLPDRRGLEAPPPPVSIEEAVERDLSRYRSLSSTHRPGDFIRRWVMVATTLAALTLLFGRDRPQQTLITVAGLCAIHEFGHWLAMRLLRFRGLYPVFIPFSGDIDRARKLHAPAWQHLAVLLAGPLPGLLFGLGVFARVLMHHEIPAWLLDAAGLSLVLNGFHLLPFLPLDGGRIADLLFFRDLPWLRPVFTIFSGLAALTGSLALKSRLMRQVAFTLFGSLIWDLRTIEVVRGARKIAWAGELSDEDEALRRAFRSVREEGNSSFVGSYGWHYKVDAMLAEVLRRRPRFGTRLLGGGLYVTAGLLPLAAVAALAILPVAPLSVHHDEPDLVKQFRDVFPVEGDAAVNPSPIAELDHLTQQLRTHGAPLSDISHEEARRQVAGRILPVISEPLDKLNWADAGIMLRRGELASATVSLWLEVLSGQMEAACVGGRDEEAVRRSEVILHAVAMIEPSPSLADRERCQDAEQRALAVIEQESAAGQIELKRLRAIGDRINLLNKEPLPEVDNYLLVQAWVQQRQAEALRKLKDSPKWD
ncbi:MAG: site-2 protease family protein, partial [Akkermansiaceae bacterium]|nr:site-2 protease family protein [Akkermansiaceae bacterium]